MSTLSSQFHTRAGVVLERPDQSRCEQCFLSGLAVSLFVLFFVFEKVSAPLGLSKLIFSVTSLAVGIPLKGVDPLIVAVPVSLLFTVVVSFFSKKPDAAHPARVSRSGK